MVGIKRVYEKPLPEDGMRILVDRLWPRGLSRQAAAIDLWMKEIAPSADLRKWFGHDSARWEEFVRRYHRELASSEASLRQLAHLAEKGEVTLVYGASDPFHNNAVALKIYLES